MPDILSILRFACKRGFFYFFSCVFVFEEKDITIVCKQLLRERSWDLYRENYQRVNKSLRKEKMFFEEKFRAPLHMFHVN